MISFNKFTLVYFKQINDLISLTNGGFLQEDILHYVDKLNDKERQILNEMGKKYSIPDYTRLLRVAKRDREEKVQELKENQKVVFFLNAKNYILNFFIHTMFVRSD